MDKRVLAGIGLGTICILSGAMLAFAQQSITLPNPIPSCNGLTCVATNIVGFLQAVALPIAIIMVLVGAFQMITAGGEPEKFSKGRKTILYAAIGTFVVLIAQGIVGIIQSLLG